MHDNNINELIMMFINYYIDKLNGSMTNLQSI